MEKKTYVILSTILILAAFVSFVLVQGYQDDSLTFAIKKDKNHGQAGPTSLEDRMASSKRTPRYRPNTQTMTIKAFGDIMFHMPQINYAKTGDGSYDFKESFQEVRGFISDSDLAVGNFETTINPSRPVSSFPIFNTPSQIGQDLAWAGFDLLSTANNHSLDSGIGGIGTSLDILHDAGLKTFGTSHDGQDKAYIFESGDMKIGFLAYTYGLNGHEGLLDTEEKKTMVNLIGEDQIKADIEDLKDRCDLILVYPHWGLEYHNAPSQDQVDLGRNMIEWGADVVIGNHPHVVQPCEFYTANDGRKGFIAYSCGNFISGQRLMSSHYEAQVGIYDSVRTEQNICYELILEKDLDSSKAYIKDVLFHPMWVGLRDGERGKAVMSHLCTDYIDSGPKYDQVDEETRSRIQKAYDMVMERLESLYGLQ